MIILKRSKKRWVNFPSIQTRLECPKCNSKLRQLIIGYAIPQLYYCPNCGYRGPIAFQPEEEKKRVSKKNTKFIKLKRA